MNLNKIDPRIRKSIQALIDEAIRQVSLTLYQCVPVATKAAATAAATGPQPKIITVAVDESDEDRPGNKYIYDGNNQPLGDPLF